MTFLRALQEEDARWKDAQETHERMVKNAQNELVEKVRTFAQEHVIGEVLVDETQRKIYGGAQ